MLETNWQFHKLDTAAELDAKPPTFTAKDAQEWCNFVVLVPSHVPQGCELQEGTLRREAPPGRVGEHTVGRTPWSENNPSAYRFEIAGQGRRARIKEFLYDWAFPALGHPCLWESNTRAEPLDERHVLWYGTDYVGNAAASARIHRTMVELSVLEGEFTEAELLDLYRSLHPVSESAAEAIGHTTFHDLSYWARRPDAPVISVPLGLWRIRQSGQIHLSWFDTGAMPAEAEAAGIPAELGGLRLDSLARETGGTDWTAWEVVYSGGPRRETELRLHAYRRSPADPPPDADDHPGQFGTVTVGGRTVHLASIDEGHGPFDAVVEDSGALRLRLMSSTGVGCDRQWFLRALEELVRAERLFELS